MDGARRRSARSDRAAGQALAALAWAVLLLCLLAAAGLAVWTAREAARASAQQASADHAQRLAQMLEQAGGSARRDAALSSYFEQHRLLGLEVDDGGGGPAYRRQAQPTNGASGNWLAPPLAPAGLPLSARAGYGAGATLRVTAAPAEPASVLWRQATLAATVLTGLSLLAWVGLRWTLRTVRRRPSDPAGSVYSVSDAAAGSPASMPGASVPAEPPPSARRLRKMARLEGLVVAQAHQIDEFKRRVQSDALTGLANRADTVERLKQALEREAAQQGAGLLLLRVRDVAAANRRVGYEVSNRVLLVVAQAVQAQADRQAGAIAGRMNGSDFVLMWPAAGDARQIAEALLARLHPAMQELDSEGGLAIGAVEVKGRTDVTRVLALADEALAAAEAGPAFAVAEIGSGREVVAFGDSVWQQRLAAALERNQTTLAGFPVCAADGNLLYLDCPMRVCIDGDDGGDDEQAWRWLAPAARGKLSRQLDLRAIDLALAAISRDGQARCINIGTDSVAASEFMLLATQALESAPDAARRLWIDLPESMALRHRALLVETARRWRPLGVRLALEHAGTDLPRIADLGGLGIDCVRIDARFVSGLTGPDSTAARRRLQALVNQVHGAGLRISAEGVALAGDLAVVWALGFDAATGPAVLKRGHSISPK